MNSVILVKSTSSQITIILYSYLSYAQNIFMVSFAARTRTLQWDDGARRPSKYPLGPPKNWITLAKNDLTNLAANLSKWSNIWSLGKIYHSGSNNFLSQYQIQCRDSNIWLWDEVLYKVVLIRLGIYFFVNKARGDGSPKFFIHTLWCHNYMRLKFQSYDFNIRGSIKTLFTPFFEI
jgi:hypothetical protein